MLIQIKKWTNGSVIHEIEADNLRTALEMLTSEYAKLRYADLSYADLSSANLRYADLSSADLRSAKLRSANLIYAVGLNKYLCTPLLMLLDQPGPIRAYKLVNSKGVGPFNGGINYLDKDTFSAENANTDETEQCGAGINLATLDWCMKEWKEGYHILIMEFTSDEIAVIPTATDGKFRVKSCRRVGEIDLVKIGLIKKGQKVMKTFRQIDSELRSIFDLPEPAPDPPPDPSEVFAEIEEAEDWPAQVSDLKECD